MAYVHIWLAKVDGERGHGEDTLKRVRVKFQERAPSFFLSHSWQAPSISISDQNWILLLVSPKFRSRPMRRKQGNVSSSCSDCVKLSSGIIHSAWHLKHTNMLLKMWNSSSARGSTRYAFAPSLKCTTHEYKYSTEKFAYFTWMDK